jgi:predicted phosphodiesterase
MKYSEKFNYIGVIGDVHAEDELLQLCINFLKEKNVEQVFCVGDIVDGQGDIEKCCNILIEERVISVLGNHDRWLLQNEMRTLREANFLSELSEHSKTFLKQLPSTIEFFTSDSLGLLCHGYRV